MIAYRNIELFTPQYVGKKDIIIWQDRILKIMEGGTCQAREILGMPLDWLDGQGYFMMPGIIDPHVHILGGGGEGGFSLRTPELVLSEAIKGGTTTVVGVLGTDGYARKPEDLVAKAKGLKAQGLSVYLYTGSYQIPVRTLTPSVAEDLMFIEEYIGVGEIAVSDHRSSFPTTTELGKIIAEARLGGILADKAGVVNFHMGDGKTEFDQFDEILEASDLPIRHIYPTHVNRNPTLFEKGLEFAKKGGVIDFTTSTVQAFLDEGEVKAAHAVKRALEAGVSEDQMTLSSDGQGSLPLFDAKGVLQGVTFGRLHTVYDAFSEMVLKEGVPLESAIKIVTQNPARQLQLKGSGHLKEGGLADALVVDKASMTLVTTYLKGEKAFHLGKVLKRGPYEIVEDLI